MVQVHLVPRITHSFLLVPACSFRPSVTRRRSAGPLGAAHHALLPARPSRLVLAVGHSPPLSGSTWCRASRTPLHRSTCCHEPCPWEAQRVHLLPRMAGSFQSEMLGL